MWLQRDKKHNVSVIFHQGAQKYFLSCTSQGILGKGQGAQGKDVLAGVGSYRYTNKMAEPDFLMCRFHLCQNQQNMQDRQEQ